ncbi:MAG: hypothetical protein CMJ46_13260 [Planctomyces sp.]|nr:hypothetical protein [Planctomyces sp.]
MNQARRNEYESSRQSTFFLLTLCALQMISGVCWAFVLSLLIYVYRSGLADVGNPLFRSLLKVEKALLWIDMGLALLFFIGIVLWIFRSSRNAFALSVHKPPFFTPGLATLLCVIPVLNLFAQLPVMSQIWNHSVVDTRREGSFRPSPTILIWFVSWVVGTIATVVILFQTMFAGPVVFNVGRLTTVIIGLVTLVFAALMYIRLHRHQEAKRRFLIEPPTPCPACGEEIRGEVDECPVCGAVIH